MLSLTGLTQHRSGRPVLSNVDLHLRAGEFAVLLGPNGAGKSTLFQVLTGLFAPDRGKLLVGGHDMQCAPSKALACLGVVFQQTSLDLDLSVRRNLKFHADLQGMAYVASARRIAESCEAMGLAADLDRKTRELSGGNRRKVEIARALLHRPSVLLLDEPTVGLDPKSRHDLLAAIVADVRTRGSVVLWATHLVEEAEAADRVLVLHKGRLLADGTPTQVSATLDGGSLEQAFLRATG